MVRHLKGKSWNGWDSRIINKLYCNPYCIVLLTLGIIFIFRAAYFWRKDRHKAKQCLAFAAVYYAFVFLIIVS